MPKPRKDGRVLLAVAMWPGELADFEAYATAHARSKSEQARLELVGKVEAWRRRNVKRLPVTRRAAKPKAKCGV